MNKGTIAIDFDGVIHKYSKGWSDGTCYDKPINGAFESIKEFMDNGYSVFILSTRSPRQIKKWLDDYIYEYWGPLDEIMLNGGYMDSIQKSNRYGFTAQIIPFWKKFWNKKYVLGITKKKLPAMVYIDDRAMKFDGSWNVIINNIKL